jgi:1,4-dihydroxy-2-naphthoyl-CoA hydrolase
MNKDTLMEKLGIQYVEIGENYVVASMPVDHRTKQPMGLLHGGASAALVETVGSLGSVLLINHETQYAVGLEVSANHVGGIQAGEVLATATLVHGGKSTHLWSIEVREKGTNRLVCTGKHTVMVLEKKA